MVKDFFTFGDINTLDYCAVITDKEIDTLPTRSYEVISIPGRNGNLLIDNECYNNVQITYTLNFLDKDMCRRFVSDISAIVGYARLEDSEYTDEYRMAYITDGSSVTRLGTRKNYREVVLLFNCKPQRWLKTGEYGIDYAPTAATTNYIYNPTAQIALPLFYVTTNDSGFTIYMNYNEGSTNKIIVTAGQKNFYIDCEKLDCWSGSGTSKTNMNQYVDFSGDCSIHGGETSMRISAACEFTMTPRWWRI